MGILYQLDISEFLKLIIKFFEVIAFKFLFVALKSREIKSIKFLSISSFIFENLYHLNQV